MEQPQTIHRCKFTGYHCKLPRTEGKYCKLHECNCDQVEKKSKGETAIADILKLIRVPFSMNDPIECNPYLPDHHVYFDFYLTTLSAAIEYDGWGHFDVTDTRTYNQYESTDQTKDQWCRDNGVPLLRISYQDMDNIVYLVKQFIMMIPEITRTNKHEIIWSSGAKCYNGLRYAHIWKEDEYYSIQY